ncbi:hypothetical protein FNP_1682 [Fusobacterium polymorphum ATCC 10953]|uniref:Uncharacterized protein n=2 Tax=Fusobacterium nucleatum subsp. polymorphum TaxID=76857 RepID=A5TX30_FUSNP|nr:hypothetical protein FNP_1682 [Fusobacterium polymorphum ATCC 10953]
MMMRITRRINKMEQKVVFKKIEDVLYAYPKYQNRLKEEQKHLTNVELEKSYRLKELNNQNCYKYKSDLEKLEETRDRIYHNIQRYEEILFRINEALDMVKGHKYYDFIPMKYFNKMTYEYIAEKFDINVSSVYKAKNKILGSLEIHFLAQKLICY